MASFSYILLAICFVAASAEEFGLDFDFVENMPKGFEAAASSSRVIGGFEARRGQFAYQAALVVNRNGILTLCSGAIGSTTTILTTASCAAGATSIDVLLGVQSIRNLTEEGRITVSVPGAHVRVHPGWTGKSSAYNIALVYLTSAITFNNFVKPINLPSWSEVTNPMTGTIVYVTGWGRTSNDADYGISDQLRYATVNIESFQTCQYFYGRLVHASNMCLKVTEGKGGCRGDEGSPIVTNGKLYGLLSFTNYHGCVACVPSVLTKTAYFLDWIEANSDIVIRL